MRYASIGLVSAFAVMVLLVLPQACGSGGGSKAPMPRLAEQASSQADSDSPSSPETEGSVAEEPDTGSDESTEQEEESAPPGYGIVPIDEEVTVIRFYDGEEYPPPDDIIDFVYFQKRYNWDKEASAGEFRLFPELNCGEECIERFELEVTDPWKTFAGRDVVRVEIKAVNVVNLGGISLLLAGEPGKYIPLWVEPGDIFPLEHPHTNIGGHDTIAADGGMGIGVSNWDYVHEVEYRPGHFSGKNGYECGWDGSGTLAYAYFLKEDWWREQETLWARHTSIEGYRDMAEIPPIAFVLSDVYTPEMFGGRENLRLQRCFEVLDSGGLEELYIRSDSSASKAASRTEEGDYTWDELTPEDKAEHYPPAHETPGCALTTQSFTLWPINGDWTADEDSAQYYEAEESCSPEPDPYGYYDIELEINAVDAPEWIGSWLVVRYPAEYEFDYQEIGTFFGDEVERIGTALTGIYEHLEAGVVRVHYEENGGSSGSGWIETLHFKYNPGLGGEGLGGGGQNSGLDNGMGGKTTSIYKVIRRFADQFDIYDDPYLRYFYGTTLDNYYTQIYKVWYDFREVNGGDYNNDTRINIADITPIARFYNQQLASPPNFEDPVTYVDGDLSNRITVGDITPIAMFYGFWNRGIYVQLYQNCGGNMFYESGSTRIFDRVPPNVYLTSANPWVHPMYHVLLGENAEYIGRHYLSTLRNGYWDYAHRYVHHGQKYIYYIVSSDQLGRTFQWTLRNR
ncbi:hypothetical protein J7J84_06535 [bacterium]|nr:hypothetical protein [bacterium]